MRKQVGEAEDGCGVVGVELILWEKKRGGRLGRRDVWKKERWRCELLMVGRGGREETECDATPGRSRTINCIGTTGDNELRSRTEFGDKKSGN